MLHTAILFNKDMHGSHVRSSLEGDTIRFFRQHICALWHQVQCDVPFGGRARGLCTPELSRQEGRMPAPLGILFCWKFIQYISALWHQVHGVSSLLVGEQGACALLSSPGRRDACRHLWESSFVGNYTAHFSALASSARCVVPWQTGLFTAGFDQALDGACQWYDTKFPRLHVRRYSTSQLHTMNAGARSVCVIAALC